MSATVLIDGPTVRGTFFIRDSADQIWDGKRWRGFGRPAEFSEFKDALREARKAKAEHRKLGL